MATLFLVILQIYIYLYGSDHTQNQISVVLILMFIWSLNFPLNFFFTVSVCISSKYIYIYIHILLNYRLLQGIEYSSLCYTVEASLVAQVVKNPPTMQETWVQPLGWEDALEKGMSTHFLFYIYGCVCLLIPNS